MNAVPEHLSAAMKNPDLLGRAFFSHLLHKRTYAETLPNGTKESPAETIERVTAMHVKRFPQLENEIRRAFLQVHARRAIPSMRAMQFAGRAIERSHARIYNCCATAITSWRDIADIFWLSMNGCGVGYSVMRHHIKQLPVVANGSIRMFRVDDTKEAWADSVLALLENPQTVFNYDHVRPEGSPLSTGGTASGPEPLRKAHEYVRSILRAAVGRQLRPSEVHRIVCLFADAVVVGGVRRSALISLFSDDDKEMLRIKTGEWYKDQKYLRNANNSVVLYRHDPQIDDKIRDIMTTMFDGLAGEPGLFISNDLEWLLNPCAEISLRNGQMCNLTEVNAAGCNTITEFFSAVEAAAIIGTLQASYTDFPYIQAKWKQNCELDALIGVSLTGQAQAWNGLVGDATLLKTAANCMMQTNEHFARRIGINPSARCGTTKPSGSASTWLRTSPGAHAEYDRLYLRRMQLEKNSPLAHYLIDLFGLGPAGSDCVVEEYSMSDDLVVVTAPHVAPEGTILARNESPIDLLNRARHIKENWILPSHRSGANTHNVSLTCYYKEHEKQQIIDWLVENKTGFSGISFFPYDGGTYQQTPFQSINESEFNDWVRKFRDVEVDLDSIDFTASLDNRQSEAACAGGQCLIL